MAELYKGIAGSPITYLTSDISAAQTTISIADDSALPDAPNICTIGYGENIETIRYGAKSNGVLQNVTRGIEGTPRAWQSGTEVARFYTAYDHNAIIQTIMTHMADKATQSSLGHIKLQEDFINGTLLNDWTGTLQYAKNDLGLVTVLFNCRAGIVAGLTNISSLPAGYRPIVDMVFPVLDSNRGEAGNFNLYIHSDGRIRITGDADFITDRLYKGQISYYTGV